jgi:large conductance mechanosensitive channel
MGMLQEFRDFAVKGNALDLAVGVIIGGAFGKIVDSVVKDLIMPFINLILKGEVDFSNKYVVLSGNVPVGATLAEAQKAGNVFSYGNFITVLIQFIIIALVIFLMVKQINRLKREEPAPAPAVEVTPEDVLLLREIRDALKK